MNNWLIALITTLLFTVSMWIPAARSASKLPIVRIGIVRDGPPGRLPDLTPLVKEEILRLTSREFDVRFPAAKSIEGNWEQVKIERSVDKLLADPEVDLVITLGYLATNYVCHKGNLPKPVVAPIVADAKLQNLPLKNGASGVKNLSYIDSFVSFERDIRVFREMVPFRSLVVLTQMDALEYIPWLEKYFRRIAQEYTIDINIVPVEFSADEALAAFPSDTDAVYLFPLAQLPPGEFRKLLYGLILRRLPSFSLLGGEDVEAGVLASVAPKDQFLRITRRIALNVQRILLGEEASSLKVAFPLGEKLTINMATGRAIGFYPSWSALTEAELLNEKVERVERRLSLESAVRESIAANLGALCFAASGGS
jgi:hypothetical protein